MTWFISKPASAVKSDTPQTGPPVPTILRI